MEYPLEGEAEVAQLGHLQLQNGQEDAFGGLRQIAVLHRGPAHDGRQVDGVSPAGDAGDVEAGVPVGQRVVAGVVAERALPHGGLLGVDVSLEHELRVPRHPQVAGDAFCQRDGPPAQEAREQHLVETGRQRRGRGVGDLGAAAERDRDGHFPAVLPPRLIDGRAVLVLVPVHGGGGPVKHLHPVHAAVLRPRAGQLGEDERQGEEAAAVLRPAVEHRQRREVGLPLDHLLAGRAGKAQAAPVGKAGGEARETRGEADEVSEGGVVAEIEIAGHVAADFVEAFGAQRERHARVGAHRVDEQGEIGALDPLEEKGPGRPAS